MASYRLGFPWYRTRPDISHAVIPCDMFFGLFVPSMFIVAMRLKKHRAGAGNGVYFRHLRLFDVTGFTKIFSILIFYPPLTHNVRAAIKAAFNFEPGPRRVPAPSDPVLLDGAGSTKIEAFLVFDAPCVGNIRFAFGTVFPMAVCGCKQRHFSCSFSCFFSDPGRHERNISDHCFSRVVDSAVLYFFRVRSV